VVEVHIDDASQFNASPDTAGNEVPVLGEQLSGRSADRTTADNHDPERFIRFAHFAILP
jgi:hypothetical protein